jgi:hypothetical protein
MSSLPASADEAALETRIALLAGQPYSAVAGVLERGGERASATFLFICRRAKELPREEFDATVIPGAHRVFTDEFNASHVNASTTFVRESTTPRTLPSLASIR